MGEWLSRYEGRTVLLTRAVGLQLTQSIIKRMSNGQQWAASPELPVVVEQKGGRHSLFRHRRDGSVAAVAGVCYVIQYFLYRPPPRTARFYPWHSWHPARRTHVCQGDRLLQMGRLQLMIRLEPMTSLQLCCQVPGK